MQNPEQTARSVLVQTTLRVAEGEDEELIVVSDRGCQTVTTISPDAQTSAIVPLLEYTPYSEIVTNSIKVYDLPKKYQIQFELSGAKVRKKNLSISDGTLKGALKKSSTQEALGGDKEKEGSEKEEGEEPNEDEEKSETDQESEDDLRHLMNIADAPAMKIKQDEDCQTDLTVIPPILDDDAIANVCTQLGVQTSLTFEPNDSLTKITPELKKYLSHSKISQAVVIDGKIIPTGGEPPKVPHKDEAAEKKLEEKLVEDVEQQVNFYEKKPEEQVVESKTKPDDTEEPKPDDAGEPKPDDVGKPKPDDEGEPKPDDEGESKPDNEGIPKPDDAEKKSTKTEDAPKDVQVYQLTMTEEEFERNVRKVLDSTVKNVYDFMAKIVQIYEQSNQAALAETSKPIDSEQVPHDDQMIRRNKAFEHIKKVLRGEIDPDKFKITDGSDGTRIYEINDEEGKEIQVEEKFEIIWRDEKASPSSDEEMKQILDLVQKIHKNELEPSDYTETINPNGTRTYLLTLGEVNLKVLDSADFLQPHKSVSAEKQGELARHLSLTRQQQAIQQNVSEENVGTVTAWEGTDTGNIEASIKEESIKEDVSIKPKSIKPEVVEDLKVDPVKGDLAKAELVTEAGLIQPDSVKVESVKVLEGESIKQGSIKAETIKSESVKELKVESIKEGSAKAELVTEEGLVQPDSVKVESVKVLEGESIKEGSIKPESGKEEGSTKPGSIKAESVKELEDEYIKEGPVTAQLVTEEELVNPESITVESVKVSIGETVKADSIKTESIKAGAGPGKEGSVKAVSIKEDAVEEEPKEASVKAKSIQEGDSIKQESLKAEPIKDEPQIPLDDVPPPTTPRPPVPAPRRRLEQDSLNAESVQEPKIPIDDMPPPTTTRRPIPAPRKRLEHKVLPLSPEVASTSSDGRPAVDEHIPEPIKVDKAQGAYFPVIPPHPLRQPIDEIGDTQEVKTRGEIECECGIVHDGGAAPPVLAVGDKKLRLEFKLGGRKTMEKAVDGFKLKATISDTNEYAAKDKTIVISFNVSDSETSCNEVCIKSMCDCSCVCESTSTDDRLEIEWCDQVPAVKTTACICEIPLRDEELCSCASQSHTRKGAGEKKDNSCSCSISRTKADRETATKKCGPECEMFSKGKRIKESLCQALREELTGPKTKQKICDCGQNHSVNCIAKLGKYEGAQTCTCKKGTDPQPASMPKVCNNTMQKMMECLKQQNFKDPAMLEKHMRGLKPLMQQMEGISLQTYQTSSISQQRCVCASSVQVIYKKSDESKSKGTCTNLREKYKPPPQIYPVCQRPNKACNCDLTYGEGFGKDTTPLYQEDDEYKETYYDSSEGIERKSSSKETLSLPDVANETNRCRNKPEIPWMKLSLPPPGCIKIKKQPKKPCDCKKKREKANMDRIVGTCVCPSEKLRCVCKETKRGASSKEKCNCKSGDGRSKASAVPCSCKEEQQRREMDKRSTTKKPSPYKPPPLKEITEDDVTCPCRKATRPCPELKFTRLLYDDINYATNEEYMNPLCKLFPDESERPCGNSTEIDWDDFTIPTKVKLGSSAKKKRRVPTTCSAATSTSQISRSTAQPERGRETKEISTFAPGPIMLQDASTSKETPIESLIEFDMKFSGYTEIISTQLTIEGGAQDQHTVSEVSAISDITKTVKRMDPNFVKTVLATGEMISAYGIMPTVGSGTFMFVGDAEGGMANSGRMPQLNAVPQVTPISQVTQITEIPQVTSMPQIPEKVSDLIKMISYDPSTKQGGKAQPAVVIIEETELPQLTEAELAVMLPFLMDDLNIKIPPTDSKSEPITQSQPPKKIDKQQINETKGCGKDYDKTECKGKKKRQEPILAGTPQSLKSPDVRSKTSKYSGGVSSTASPRSIEQKRSAASSYTESEYSLDRLASPIIAAIKTVEKEMQPLHDTLNEIRAKIQSMDIPELDNWNKKASCSAPCNKSPYGNSKQVNVMIPQVSGPFSALRRQIHNQRFNQQDVQRPQQFQQRQRNSTPCICLQSVDDDYGPRTTTDIIDETMGLDKMVKQNIKPTIENNKNYVDDFKDYEDVVERTMALDKLIRENFKKSTYSDSFIKEDKEKQTPPTRNNIPMDYQTCPNSPNYYPFMMDWFFQNIYNHYFYSYYYPESFVQNLSQPRTVANGEMKKPYRKKKVYQSSMTSSSSRTSYSKTSESETYPTTKWEESSDVTTSFSYETDDTIDSHFDLSESGSIVKTKERSQGMARRNRKAVKIIVRKTPSGHDVSRREEVYSTSSSDVL